jgi:release factor glutamine methyltransferase
MTLGELILEGKARLASAGLECADPFLHMKQIAEAALSLSSSALVLRWEEPVSGTQREAIEAILVRRLTGEPFQYIVGYEWFWDSKFAVGPGVLIPRPETELLLELLFQTERRPELRVAELGAGTGILGISALQERPEWTWTAWENNPASLPYVERNLSLLAPPIRPQYRLQPGDFFAGVEAASPFDWLVANPPYVARGELAGLSREVRHEPPLALDGGPTGLDLVERLLDLAPKILAPGGGVLLEIGSDQGPGVLDRLKRVGLLDARIEKDLAGRDRVAYGRRS